MADFRYAVIGTGAVGGFYGAKLQQAGQDVHFLLHRDYQHVKEQGLRIDSVEGDFLLPEVQAYQSTQTMPKCDAVIVALKTTQNHLLAELLPPILKPDSAIILLQNGIGVEPELAQKFPTQHILGGLCFLCSNKVAPGYIHHVDYGAISLGEYGENYSARGITATLKKVAADFTKAGVEINLVENLLAARWQKLVWNIPFNGLSVVLDATTNQLIENPAIYELSKQLMYEVRLGAEAHSCDISEDFIQKMLNHTAQMKPYRTSMKIDFDLQRPLEIEAMFHAPLAIAASFGVELPKIKMLYQQLSFLNQQNLA